MLRLLLVIVTIVPGTLWYGAKVIWASYRQGPDARRITDESQRAWARFILRWSGVDVVLENPEAIDPRRPQVLVANHTSWYDVLALAAFVPGQSVFVAKQEIARVPVFGRAAAACGQIFIDRSDRNRAVESLAAAREILENESPTIIMFPEGTRSATGRLQPFKKGAFVLAIQAGVDIVPAAIFGSHEVMGKGSLFIRPGTIRVRFGESIGVAGLTIEDRGELTEQAWQALASLQASAH